MTINCKHTLKNKTTMISKTRNRKKCGSFRKGQRTCKRCGGKSFFQLFKRRSSKQIKQNDVFHGIVEEHKLTGYFMSRMTIKPLVVTCNSSILQYTRTHPQKDEIQITLVIEYKQLLDVILQKLNVANIIKLGSKNEDEKIRCTKLFCKHDITTNEKLLNCLQSSTSSTKMTSSEISDILECKNILALQTVKDSYLPKNLLTQKWGLHCDDNSANKVHSVVPDKDGYAIIPDKKGLTSNSSINSNEKRNRIVLLANQGEADTDHATGGNGLFNQSFGSLHDDFKTEIIRALHSKLSVKLDNLTSSTVDTSQVKLEANDRNSARLLKILNKFNSNVARFGQRNKSVLKLTRSNNAKPKWTKSKSSSSEQSLSSSDDDDNKAKVYIKVLLSNIYDKKKGWVSTNSSKTLYDTLVDLIKDETSILICIQNRRFVFN